MMFPTFDAAGAIPSCTVMETSGDAPPTYNCDQAKKERFRALASAEPNTRQASLTILAYGHTEKIADETRGWRKLTTYWHHSSIAGSELLYQRHSRAALVFAAGSIVWGE